MTRRSRPAQEPVPCSSCSALVIWTQWATGKRMPVDVTPHPAGNLALTLRKSENVVLVETYDVQRHARHQRFVSHFQSCPNAAQHRRKG